MSALSFASSRSFSLATRSAVSRARASALATASALRRSSSRRRNSRARRCASLARSCFTFSCRATSAASASAAAASAAAAAAEVCWSGRRDGAGGFTITVGLAMEWALWTGLGSASMTLQGPRAWTRCSPRPPPPRLLAAADAASASWNPSTCPWTSALAALLPTPAPLSPGSSDATVVAASIARMRTCLTFATGIICATAARSSSCNVSWPMSLGDRCATRMLKSTRWVTAGCGRAFGAGLRGSVGAGSDGAGGWCGCGGRGRGGG
mmetsp:Transcript_10358/g.29587  ORF Transcript_10358/g.29587 Transcript_10358/m.29587 type:complete len:267 (-) Transcript_10358:872-1672(-)